MGLRELGDETERPFLKVLGSPVSIVRGRSLISCLIELERIPMHFSLGLRTWLCALERLRQIFHGGNYTLRLAANVPVTEYRY